MLREIVVVDAEDAMQEAGTLNGAQNVIASRQLCLSFCVYKVWVETFLLTNIVCNLCKFAIPYKRTHNDSQIFRGRKNRWKTP